MKECRENWESFELVMLPTENNSPLFYYKERPDILFFEVGREKISIVINNYLYLLSDDKIRRGDWVLYDASEIYQCETDYNSSHFKKYGVGCRKKIIATTNPDLTIRHYVPSGSCAYGESQMQQIPNDFVKEFAKANGNGYDDGVLVKMEKYMPQINGLISDGIITHEISLNPADNTLTVLDVTDNNEIIVKLNKDKWNDVLNNIADKIDIGSDKTVIEQTLTLLQELYHPPTIK